jgi:hypothetical protein
MSEVIKPATIQEVSKSQFIRIMDIVLIGPLMLKIALGKKPGALTKGLMLVFGVSTIYYNWRNYNRNKEYLLSTGQQLLSDSKSAQEVAIDLLKVQ